TFPFWSVERSAFERPEYQTVLKVFSVEEAWPRFTTAEKVVEAEKTLLPENVLLFARSVEEAAVTVTEPPALRLCPLIVPNAPVRRFVPIDVVAMTRLLLSIAKSEDAVRPVRYTVLVAVNCDVLAFVKFCAAVHQLLFPRLSEKVCDAEPLYAEP